MKRLIFLPLIAVAAIACDAVPTYEEPGYTGNPSGPKVAIVGDADMETVAPALHAALDPTYRVRIAGNEQTTVEMWPTIDAFLDVFTDENGTILGPNHPQVFVFMPPWLDVATGAPDPFELYGFTAGMGDPTQGIREDTLAAGACYVFGTLTYDSADVDAANDLLRSPELASVYPDVVLADWDAVVNANPGYQDGAGNVTPSGEAALVGVIADAVEACP